MTVNRNTESLVEVEKDVDEIQKDVDEIQEEEEQPDITIADIQNKLQDILSEIDKIKK